MQTVTVKSFVHFIEHSDFFDVLADQVIFRGQPVKGNLLPGIARGNPKVDTTEVEAEMIESLKVMGASHLPNVIETDLDLLVRAQHFGMKTRLLDWTSNSLAALWFACASEANGDVFVYAFEVDKLTIGSSIYTQDPFNTAKTRAFLPRLNNPRVIAQHGWFTLHRYSKTSKQFVPLDKNKETSGSLHEYRIPEDIRESILIALDRHGVSARTLFPDIGGLCQHINWKQREKLK